MIPLLKAWGFASSPIGRALGVGLIAVMALGYAYMKGEESGRADSQEAALRAQIETLRADLRITMRAAEQAAAQVSIASYRKPTPLMPVS